jgi:uncharacterized protein YoxC
VVLTVALLGYTASSVRKAQEQIDALKKEASTYTTQIDALKKNTESYKTQSQSLQGDTENYKTQVTELQTQLAETQKALSEAVNLSRAVRPIDYANAKELASRFPVARACCWTFLSSGSGESNGRLAVNRLRRGSILPVSLCIY